MAPSNDTFVFKQLIDKRYPVRIFKHTCHTARSERQPSRILDFIQHGPASYSIPSPIHWAISENEPETVYLFIQSFLSATRTQKPVVMQLKNQAA